MSDYSILSKSFPQNPQNFAENFLVKKSVVNQDLSNYSIPSKNFPQSPITIGPQTPQTFLLAGYVELLYDAVSKQVR